MARALDFFAEEAIDRARRYHRPLYWAFLLDVAMGLAVLFVLALTSGGDWTYRRLGGLPWWGRALAFSALIATIVFVVRLPLSLWRGYAHERLWGFSTQTLPGWLTDRLKALAVSLLLTSGVLLGFVALARALPTAWPAVTAAAGALLV